MLNDAKESREKQYPVLSPNPFAEAILSFIDELKENEDRKSLFYREVVEVACRFYLTDGEIDESLASAVQLSKYIVELEGQHRKKSGVRRALAFAQPLVEGLMQYTTAIDVMIQADPTVSALIYGGARLVLQLANAYSKYFEQVGQMMADIGIQLQYFHIYTREFANNKYMNGVLYSSYRDILLFWRDSAKILSQKGKRLLGLGLLSPLNERYAKFKQKLDKNAESVRYMAQALHVQRQGSFNKVHSNQIRELATALESPEVNSLPGYQDTEAATRFEEVRKWIAGGRASRIDPKADLERHLSSRHVGTCQWIFEDAKFAKWKAVGETSLLWVNAAPGSGKSVLCASIIDTLAHSKNQDHKNVIFFFCRFDEPDKCKAISALRSIALQALKLIKYIPDELYELYREECSAEDCFIANVTIAERAVGCLLKQIPYVSVIVDGLDECHESALVDSLFRLRQQKSFGITKWLFTSRDDPVVRKRFENSTSDILVVPRAIVQGDIRKFLEDNTDLLCSTCDQLNTFAERSQGNFLMIRLTIDPFRNEELTCSEEFDEALQQFQPELGRCWFRSLQRLQQRSPQIKELAQMIFNAIILAEQPMTFNELLDLLSVKIGEEPSPRRRRSKSVVLSACSPFVEVDYDSDFTNPSVRLVHKSIGDFLRQDPASLEFVTKDCYEFFVNRESGSAEIGKRCLTYLSYKRYSEPITLDLENGTNPTDHGLLKYAAIFWYKHLQNSGGSKELFESVRNFLKSPNIWTCIRIQSMYAPHMFARLSYNSKKYIYKMLFPGSKHSEGEEDYYADALPPWLGEYDSEGDILVWGYHMFVREWAEVLVRYPDKIHRYFAQVLGPRSFWNTEDSAKRVTITTAEGVTAVHDLLSECTNQQCLTPLWTASPTTAETGVRQDDGGRSQYVEDVLNQHRGEWKIQRTAAISQDRLNAVVTRYHLDTLVKDEDSDSDSDSDAEQAPASSTLHQPSIWFLRVLDGEGAYHWFHHVTKSGLLQKSAPIFIPKTTWLLWPQDEFSTLLLNTKTWESAVNKFPESAKTNLMLLSQDHHYSSSNNALHRVSIYGSKTNDLMIKHTIFDFTFNGSASDPPKIIPSTYKPQETTWRCSIPSFYTPISFYWHETAVYAALGTSALKILRFPLPSNSISTIQIFKKRFYIPCSSHSRNLRFFVNINDTATVSRAVFIISEVRENHLPAVKLDFAMNEDDWEEYDPSLHDEEAMTDSAEFFKGAYASKDQAFSVPIRSGLDWRRSVYVTCW